MVAEPEHERDRAQLYDLGKTNLTDGADWECPANAAHRFFKVTVELP